MQIGKLSVEVRRKAMKNLHISVFPPSGVVRVSAPLKMSDDAVKMAVASRLLWIKKQQSIFENQARETTREIVSGESHYLWGKRYLLEVLPTTGRHRLEVEHRKIKLFVRTNTDFKNQTAVIETFYRNELKREIANLPAKWQPKMGVTAKRFGVKKMKTLWGSCNTDTASIWLNLELAKKPPECLEYVVVHELTHLLERHHNARFMAHIDNFLPNWRNIKQRLNALKLGV